MKTTDWLTLGAVLGVGYLAYRTVGVVGAAGAAAGAAYDGAVNWTSELFGSWFGPSGGAGTDVYHIVNFPDGARHAIGANLVDQNGTFTYNGYPYQLGKDAGGNWVAV